MTTATIQPDLSQEADIIEHLELGYRLERRVVRNTQTGQIQWICRLTSPQVRQWGSRYSSLRSYQWFDTREQRDAAADLLRQEVAEKVARRQAKTAEKRLAAQAWQNPFKVGEILHSSWGYEQTNVEHFEILEVRPRSIKVCEVEQKLETDGALAMSGTVTAQPGKYKGEPVWITIQLRVYGGNVHASVPSPIHGNLYQGGSSARCSWYA